MNELLPGKIILQVYIYNMSTNYSHCFQYFTRWRLGWYAAEGPDVKNKSAVIEHSFPAKTESGERSNSQDFCYAYLYSTNPPSKRLIMLFILPIVCDYSNRKCVYTNTSLEQRYSDSTYHSQSDLPGVGQQTLFRYLLGHRFSFCMITYIKILTTKNRSYMVHILSLTMHFDEHLFPIWGFKSQSLQRQNTTPLIWIKLWLSIEHRK